MRFAAPKRRFDPLNRNISPNWDITKFWSKSDFSSKNFHFWPFPMGLTMSLASKGPLRLELANMGFGGFSGAKNRSSVKLHQTRAIWADFSNEDGFSSIWSLQKAPNRKNSAKSGVGLFCMLLPVNPKIAFLAGPELGRAEVSRAQISPADSTLHSWGAAQKSAEKG